MIIYQKCLPKRTVKDYINISSAQEAMNENRKSVADTNPRPWNKRKDVIYKTIFRSLKRAFISEAF